MGKGSAEAAAVEVDDVFAATQRKDDTLIENIAVLRADEINLAQQCDGVTTLHQILTQVPARGIADAELFDQSRIVDSAFAQIAECLGIAIKLLLIESSSLLEHCGRVGFRSGP